ncbi:MAG: hypothetical protein AAFQ95_14680 [Cyanobacteria bacterium J06621_3]
MTHWNILIEPAKDGQTTATVVELPTFQVTANTRQTALDYSKTYDRNAPIAIGFFVALVLKLNS